MKEYHKIQTVFKRDMETKYKKLIDGAWTTPEFEYLAKNQWVFTEKVDGTNIRVMSNNGKVTFGGKTDNAQIPSQLIARLNELFFDSKELAKMGDLCLYGEGYGAKIQKIGSNYLPYQDFVLFDVRVDDLWLQRKDIEEIAEKLNIHVVPIIGRGTLHLAIEVVKQGFTSTWGEFSAEGIVARPATELKTRAGERIITKIKTCDFK